MGLDPANFGTHSLHRTKAVLIYRRTGNLRTVQLLLGRSKIESTVRYLGIGVTMRSTSDSVTVYLRFQMWPATSLAPPTPRHRKAAIGINRYSGPSGDRNTRLAGLDGQCSGSCDARAGGGSRLRAQAILLCSIWPIHVTRTHAVKATALGRRSAIRALWPTTVDCASSHPTPTPNTRVAARTLRCKPVAMSASR